MQIELPDLAATEALGARIAGLLRSGDAVLLEGPLGAGKSALARAILRALLGDPALEVPSPSYTLVQGYTSWLGLVQHFDLWRLDGPGALLELGWEEALEGVAIVEWPDRLGGLKPAGALHISLSLRERGGVRVTAGTGLADDRSRLDPHPDPLPEGEGEGRLAVISGWEGRFGSIGRWLG